jgi:PRTRC genetic system protein B
VESSTRSGIEESTALIRYLVEHAQYDAALLFTRGQYILYRRDGAEVACKGVEALTLRTAFVQEPVDSGWLPEGVLRWGSGPAGIFMVKFVPPGKQRIHLGTQTIEPPLPALLFAGVNRIYYVWALRGKTCDSSAQLFHAPFPNVYSDGRICFGNNRPPQVGEQTFNEAWQLFLTSPFNADMTSGKSQAEPSDVRRQLIQLAVENAKRYPVQDLKPYIGGQSYLVRHKELRTANDVIDHYLLKKEQD